MKVFKIILKVFLVLIFIVSVTFNIAIFGSSYGSLTIKYDETKFLSMSSYTSSNIYSTFLGYSKNKGLQLEVTNVGDCDKLIANYYFDNEKNASFETKCTYLENDETKTNSYYYKDNVLYTDINGAKSKQTLNYSTAITTILSLETYKDILFLEEGTIRSNNGKTHLNFSFKPFYFMGINYSYTSDAGSKYSYNYDLKGTLRKVSVSNKDEKKQTYVINYKNNKINFPNLNDF